MKIIIKKEYLKENLFFRLCNFASRAYIRAMFQKKISPSFLPTGPKIYAVNHPSTLDPFYMMGIIHEPFHALLTTSVFNTFLLGKLLKLTGHIEVGHHGGAGPIDQAISKLNSGRSVMIFPEGTISPGNCTIGRLHTGVIRIALKSNVPIVPVVIKLNPKKIKKTVLWIDQVREECNWYFRGRYTVTYGNPIYINGNFDNRDLVNQYLSVLQDRMNEIIALPLPAYV